MLPDSNRINQLQWGHPIYHVAGWSRQVVVEAFVVNIKHAAAPDEAGLVNPLLDRYNARGCHYSVFGLPAVQVRAGSVYGQHRIHYYCTRVGHSNAQAKAVLLQCLKCSTLVLGLESLAGA